jgi:hypothetical protein
MYENELLVLIYKNGTMDILPTQNHFSAANGNAPKEK